MSGLPDGDLEHRHPLLQEGQERLADNQEQIISVLEGPRIAHLGGPDTREDGLVSQVGEMQKDIKYVKAKLDNGGFNVDLPLWTKVAGFILTVVLIVQAIVGIVHGLS